MKCQLVVKKKNFKPEAQREKIRVLISVFNTVLIKQLTQADSRVNNTNTKYFLFHCFMFSVSAILQQMPKNASLSTKPQLQINDSCS